MLAQKHPSASVSIRQHTSANSRQGWHLARTKAYVSIRQHTSASVSIRPTRVASCSHKSIRKNTSAYVSIRQGATLLAQNSQVSEPAVQARSIAQQHAVVTPPRLRLCIHQHPSAYVSIRQHTSAACCCHSTTPPPLHTSADVSIRQHTSAYVSTMLLPLRHASASAYVSRCQHTSTYVSIRQQHAIAAPPRRRLRMALFVSILTFITVQQVN